MNSQSHPLLKSQIPLRVRYQETDAQGRVHHAVYINYFECARVEMLRQGGISYRDLEDQGILLVVTEASCRYFGGAVFDDLLQVSVETVRAKGTRIEHHYQIHRGEDLLVSGRTVVACINREGRPQPLPEFLRLSVPNR